MPSFVLEKDKKENVSDYFDRIWKFSKKRLYLYVLTYYNAFVKHD